MTQPQADQPTIAVSHRPRGLVFICAALLAVCLVLWGLSFALGAAVIRVQSTPKGGIKLPDGRTLPTINLSEYYSLMSARGNIVFSNGAVSAPDARRPVGDSGWSCTVAKAAAFAPVPAPGDESTLVYHLGQRWLPTGTELTLPYWGLAIVIALLLGLSVYRAGKIQQEATEQQAE